MAGFFREPKQTRAATRVEGYEVLATGQGHRQGLRQELRRLILQFFAHVAIVERRKIGVDVFDARVGCTGWRRCISQRY